VFPSADQSGAGEADGGGGVMEHEEDSMSEAGRALGGRFYRALVYAAAVHDGHFRKRTRIPYVSHLLIVTGLVLEHGGNEDEAIAALLHDAVEDRGGDPRLREIRAQFGDVVADIVLACSDTTDDPKPPWRARKENYLRHLELAPESVRLVSAADKLANVRSVIQDYRAIGELLWDRFSAPKNDQLWYYRRLADAFSRLGPVGVARELEAAVTELERLASGSDP
jgi:(p)ppGpp synthase/HD superfamily hydrolase